MAKRIYFISFLLTVFFSFLYISTLSKNWLFDSIFYANFLKIDEPVIHMQHILYIPLAQLMKESLYYFGIQIDPLIFLQTISAISGGMTVGIFCLLLYKITCSLKIAFIVPIMLGFSNFFWEVATNAENYTLSAVFLLLGLFFLEQKKTIFFFLCSAFFLALATSMNFVPTVMILITFLCYFLVGFKKRDLIFISTAYIIITVLNYVLIFYIYPKVYIIDYFRHIGSSWAHMQNFLDIRLWIDNLLWFLYALINPINFGFRSLLLGKVKFIPNVFYFVIFIFLVVSCVIFFLKCIVNFKHIVRKNVFWFYWCTLNLIVFYLLILWWEPCHPKKYFFCIIPFLIIVALVFGNKKWQFLNTAVAIFFCIFLGINNHLSIRQKADINKNEAYLTCVQLNKLIDDKDAIMLLKSTPYNASLLRPYLPYFFEYNNVYNLDELINKNNNSLDKFIAFLTNAKHMHKDIFVLSEVFEAEKGSEKQYIRYLKDSFNSELIWQGSIDGKEIKIYKLISS